MEKEEKKALNIYQKLIEVRKQVIYIQKNSKGFNFDYVTGSDILGALRPKMDEMGLVLIPNMESFEMITVRKGNGEIQIPKIKISYTWVNAENPTERITTEGTYFEDKMNGCQAIGSIQTYAERYFLAKFFQIAVGKDDIEDFYAKNKLKNEVEVVETKKEVVETKKEVVETKKETAVIPKSPGYALTIQECLDIGPVIWEKMRNLKEGLAAKMPGEFAHFMLHLQKQHPEFSVKAKWEKQTPDPEKILPAMHEWASSIDGNQEMDNTNHIEYYRKNSAKVA